MRTCSAARGSCCGLGAGSLTEKKGGREERKADIHSTGKKRNPHSSPHRNFDVKSGCIFPHGERHGTADNPQEGPENTHRIQIQIRNPDLDLAFGKNVSKRRKRGTTENPNRNPIPSRRVAKVRRKSARMNAGEMTPAPHNTKFVFAHMFHYATPIDCRSGAWPNLASTPSSPLKRTCR